jgi:nitroimidazol reductase NimA-like FMN-containing flavoprotein (pyridoxamine 5'-phosphate oxidase superfamily)
MTMSPITKVDFDFSDQTATPTPWQDAIDAFNHAEVFWVTSVREDGRPHQTPLLAVWLDHALYFCTGPGEQKAKNIARNAHVLLTTGSNALSHGLDVVVEGDALRVTDEEHLLRLADAWFAKYGPEWKFEVRDSAFHQEGEAWVFEVTPLKAFGFHKGTPFGQTTWRFPSRQAA